MPTNENERGSAYLRWFVGAILGIFLGAALRIPTPDTVVTVVMAGVGAAAFWFAGAFGLKGSIAQLLLSCGEGILIAGLIAHAR
ncbi:MAG TPA: hypothetical protein VJ843_05540 [Candidatus Saccharimonadales bacterium]|nr:hypothetical protein [Candidatus Saccharimonadales bacterium]